MSLGSWTEVLGLAEQLAASDPTGGSSLGRNRVVARRRWSQGRAAGEPTRQFETVPIRTRRRTRPQRWADAIDALRVLQGEYQTGVPVSPSPLQ